MSKPILAAVAVLVASLASSAVLAQASAPLSRTEVKAQTRAAAKAGELMPAGEGGARVEASDAKSTLTRAERKEATLEARKAGTLAPAGVNQKADVALQAASSTKTRTERKAETQQAVKKGELIPAGEGPGTPKK